MKLTKKVVLPIIILILILAGIFLVKKFLLLNNINDTILIPDIEQDIQQEEQQEQQEQHEEENNENQKILMDFLGKYDVIKKNNLRIIVKDESTFMLATPDNRIFYEFGYEIKEGRIIVFPDYYENFTDKLTAMMLLSKSQEILDCFNNTDHVFRLFIVGAAEEYPAFIIAVSEFPDDKFEKWLSTEYYDVDLNEKSVKLIEGEL